MLRGEVDRLSLNFSDLIVLFIYAFLIRLIFFSLDKLLLLERSVTSLRDFDKKMFLDEFNC